MGELIKLNDVRNFCDVSELSGEELLKQLVLCADESEETDEYEVFLASLKALKASSDPSSNPSLRLRVKYDKSNGSIDFYFKFDKS